MNREAEATTRHRSALGEWERAWRRPSARLRGLVDGYHGYRQRLTTAASHRGIPAATLPLVFSLGPEQTVTGDDVPPVAVGSFVAGLYDRHVLIDAEEFHGIQVDLTPAAAFRLFGRPLRELTGRTVPLEDVLGRDAPRLTDDLASAPDWQSRFRRLDRALLTWLQVDVSPRPEVTHALERIAATRGRVRVATLAAEVGWSTRHLTARFGEQLGLSPKRMARLVRFEHAAALLARPSPPPLADVAATAGYYDQAHLSNEVRAHSGLTPLELVSRRLPDDGGVFDTDGAPARR
jgi:AraC-like DNA-binding protein